MNVPATGDGAWFKEAGIFMSRIRAFVVVALVAASLPFVAAAAPVSAIDCPIPGGVGGPIGGNGCPQTTAAVPGYIYITHVGNQPRQYQLFGAISAPSLWTCWDETSSTAFTVKCQPTPSNFHTWRCDVLHADATTTSVTGRARASLDCDGLAPPEAQTSVVVGTNGHDSKFSQGNVEVVEFSCAVDGGPLLPATPDYVAGCGDPGLVEVSL